ncbi:hypothetical protein [Actinoplanes aureus]|uniref:Uncharacterized protein n=1 Tax=Actinoplanes aureus TaxID=2792083 RepID=A0A931C8U2_9ACTN|nr:hypothetical protein [Actinoplanes aureus]MBG0565569.1 hypothetical protein [Actinoplanes aureus]
MAYTPDKPKLPESSDELRARIPGWGADLDPKDRPSVPQEIFDPGFSGAHWEFPERQPERWPRERSIEHKFLTPVFGTSCPPRGLSGAIRRFSYARFSEGRAAHWLLLLAADRVDSLESRLRPPLTPTGTRSELSHHGLRSRLGRNRADAGHHLLDPVVVAAPWIIGAGLAYAVVRRITR